MKPIVTLRNWYWASLTTLRGNAVGHPAFYDGDPVHTSNVIRQWRVMDDINREVIHVVETANTFYILES